MSSESILTSISLGLLAAASPCVFPLYPGFLAYISGQGGGGGRSRYLLGFFVLAGVLSMMLALGALIALLSISIGRALAVLVPLADLLIIALGAALLLGHNPFKTLPQVRVPVLRSPLANAYLYGLLYGPIALPCSGPLVVSIFALSLTAADFLGSLSVFLWFGLGFGLPLLGLSFLAGASQRWITRQFARRSRLLNALGGLLLLGVGIYDLAANWALIAGGWA